MILRAIGYSFWNYYMISQQIDRSLPCMTGWVILSFCRRDYYPEFQGERKTNPLVECYSYYSLMLVYILDEADNRKRTMKSGMKLHCLFFPLCFILFT